MKWKFPKSGKSLYYKKGGDKDSQFGGGGNGLVGGRDLPQPRRRRGNPELSSKVSDN